MKLSSISYAGIQKHLGIWISLSIYLIIIDPIRGTLLSQIGGTFFIMISYIFVFYVLRYSIIPKFWYRNSFILGLSFIFVYLIYFGIDVVNFYGIIPFLGGDNIYQEYGIHDIFIDGMLIFVFISSASYMLYYHQLSIEKIKIQNEIEKSLIVKELNFLKNQFNSHITFNFLNFCYSQVHHSVPRVADAIELFSGILRYSLRLNPEEKIPLSEEVEYIHRYIQLQKLLSSKVYVKFEITGNINVHFILPRILVSFVENAFKHGLYYNENEPIKIKLEAVDNISFHIINRKNLQSNVIKTGIGQDNVKQILDVYYKNNYELNVKEDNTFYSMSLFLKA